MTNAIRGYRIPHPPVRAGWLELLLFLVLGLEGCATVLAPTLVLPHTVQCAPDGRDCLAQGRADFEAYRRVKLQEIRDKSQGYRLPSAPVAFIHPKRTEYSVLLIHGLNDSAYYMADLGEFLYRKGFNVITVLLPGHGTGTRDMLDVTAEQWRAEVDLGLGMASLVGQKIILGGFSLGAALAIDALLRHQEIYGLVLFSPAIRLRSFASISTLACAPVVRSYVLETDLPPNPVKYKYRVGNSVCQLSRLMEHNLRAGDTGAVTVSEKLRALAQRVRVPTFVALSYGDRRISPTAALEFAGNIPTPVLVATFGKPEDQRVPVLANGGKLWPVTDASLPHSYVVRRANPYNGQENPCFDRLATVLAEFLAQHLSSEFQPADVAYPDCGPIPEAFQGSD